jgi:hypothetical protein
MDILFIEPRSTKSSAEGSWFTARGDWPWEYGGGLSPCSSMSANHNRMMAETQLTDVLNLEYDGEVGVGGKDVIELTNMVDDYVH